MNLEHSADNPLLDHKFKLMVYGTLKRTYNNNYILSNAKYLGNSAFLRGTMFHLGHHPAISIDEVTGPIHGEVYEVTWGQILRCDELEGHPHHYLRQMIKNVPEYGEFFTYVYPKDEVDRSDLRYLVPGGLWLGQGTPKHRWHGWGKGYEKDASPTLIRPRMRAGSQKTYKSVPSELEGYYNLVDQETGQIDPAGPFKYAKSSVERNILTLNDREKIKATDDPTTVQSPVMGDSLARMMARQRPDYLEEMTRRNRNLPVHMHHPPIVVDVPVVPAVVPKSARPWLWQTGIDRFSHNGPGAEPA